MRTRGALTGCALLMPALVMLACGCSSGGGTAAPGSSTTAPASTDAATSTTAAPESTTTTPASAGPALGTLILDQAPSGYPLQPDAVADTGPTDLQKAEFDDVLSPDAHQALVRAGFVRGFERQWASDNSFNFVFLYEFATPAGAQAYVQHWRTAIAGANQGATPVPFTPLLVPGAFGLLGTDQAGSSGVVLYSKGPYAVQASSTGLPKIDQSFPVSALAYAQYARLP